VFYKSFILVSLRRAGSTRDAEESTCFIQANPVKLHMLEEVLKLQNAQEAVQAFGAEFAKSSNFGKAWNALVETAQRNGSAVPLLFALTYETSVLLSQNPWMREQFQSWFNSSKQ
jgi:hypothetical protein